MKLNWKKEELEQQWILLAEEWKLLKNKTGPTRLGFAVLMKFFQINGRFPNDSKEVPREASRFVAGQLGLSIKAWRDYPWTGRVITYHRNEIRDFFGYRKATIRDAKAMIRWLANDIINQEHRPDRLQISVQERYRNLRIEPPTTEQIHRMIQSALADHEQHFCKSIRERFDAKSTDRLNILLQLQPSDEEWTAWQTLKSDPGKAGLESIKDAVSRLQTVREIGLPDDLFKGVSPKLLERYAKRAAVEEPFELRRHIDSLRITLMAAFLHRREEELTDHLVDLLVETVHKIGKKAEKRIDDGLSHILQKAPGKIAKLYRIAKASIEAPQGIVAEVIFPEVPEKWLQTLIQEIESGTGYTARVKTAMQRSYRFHYRRMLPELFNNLEFRCTNVEHQPLMQALVLVKSQMELKKPFFPKGMEIPLKRIVPASWMPLVLEGEKVNRTAYEICVLKALREQLRCREIWVVGSRRYRNPEDDLPQDFAANRGVYFEDLGIPMDPKTFTASLREELTMHLKALDERIPTNPKVKIVSKKDGSKYAYPVDTGWRFEVETGACQITLEPCWSFSISSTVY